VFNTARREGRSIWLFDAPSAGPHVIDLDFDTGGNWDNTLPSNIAVSAGDGLSVAVARPMALMAGAGVAAGATLAGVTAIRRRRYYAATYGDTASKNGAGTAGP